MSEVPVLEAKGICKYFGGLKAVESVDMKIMKGDVFGIIGQRRHGGQPDFKFRDRR